MSTTVDQLGEWMDSKEGEHLEFKEAKQNFQFDKLVDYCAALANEGGGRMILGVTDKRPRRVTGSQAFSDLERTKAGLVERLRLRIDAEELVHPGGRVLVFHVPSRPIGLPIHHQGRYWMRAGEDLVPMTADQLKRIFDESGPDYSAEVCAKATFGDLDPAAIDEFRRRWSDKSRNKALASQPAGQLLADAGLVVGGKLTYAGLILFGFPKALARHLAQAEVVFEYRSSDAAGPAQQREEYRQGFFAFYDDLWNKISLRNDRQHFQDGLFMRDVPTFNETAVREAILNAVSHRDYRLAGSIFVRQYPRRLEVVSPGGFPPGITPENILDRQQPRNRLIADAFAKCGLVERAGQGANRIFESCISEGKALPDFTHTDAWQVSLALHGQVLDPRFVQFLDRVTAETQARFDTHEFLVLDLVHREVAVPAPLQPRLRRLIDLGVVESIGRGKGTRYLLSRRFYALVGQKGTYTRKKGLDRQQNKALLLEHLSSSARSGCPMAELQQVLPSQSRAQLKRLLDELRHEGRAKLVGERRWARWFPVGLSPNGSPPGQNGGHGP